MGRRSSLSAPGQVPDRRRFNVFHADLDELLEAAIRRHDAQCAVLRIHEFHPRLDDPVEHGRQIQMFHDGPIRPEQGAQATLCLRDMLGELDQVAARNIGKRQSLIFGHRSSLPRPQDGDASDTQTVSASVDPPPAPTKSDRPARTRQGPSALSPRRGVRESCSPGITMTEGDEKP